MGDFVISLYVFVFPGLRFFLQSVPSQGGRKNRAIRICDLNLISQRFGESPAIWTPRFQATSALKCDLEHVGHYNLSAPSVAIFLRLRFSDADAN